VEIVPVITVSVVSHGHGAMVEQLIRQLTSYPEVGQIILTRNIPEPSTLQSMEKLKIIENQAPAGFGANHNAAFQHCLKPFFCVLNPDITFSENPFPDLLSCIEKNNASLAAPLVLASDGTPEDSIRRFPTPRRLLSKALGGPDGRYTVAADQTPFYPEWVAGMFMLFSCDGFKQMGGFDTGFFLYYEDVDICVRMWKAGLKIVACPSAHVIHAAHRDSHRNWRFLRWHLASMARYFYKYFGRLPQASTEAP
jgi:GT2 family glycosyltransferase